MHSFVRRENLRRYRDLLMRTSDETVRSQLFKPIAEEERQELMQQISEQQTFDRTPEPA